MDDPANSGPSKRPLLDAPRRQTAHRGAWLIARHYMTVAEQLQSGETLVRSQRRALSIRAVVSHLGLANSPYRRHPQRHPRTSPSSVLTVRDWRHPRHPDSAERHLGTIRRHRIMASSDAEQPPRGEPSSTAVLSVRRLLKIQSTAPLAADALTVFSSLQGADLGDSGSGPPASEIPGTHRIRSAILVAGLGRRRNVGGHGNDTVTALLAAGHTSPIGGLPTGRAGSGVRETQPRV